jgi:outer membrane receptor for ferrienterochelin and colicins
LKRFLSLLLATACVTVFVSAQQVLPIYITSGNGAENIPYAEVWISTSPTFEQGHIVDFVVANEQGIAQVKVLPGTMYIKLSSAGYLEHVDSFKSNQMSVLYYQLQTDVVELEHAVVTVQYKKQAAEKAVERILVLDEKELQSRSVVNLREALIQQMNVQIRNDNSTGSAMSMMGISGQNVKILIDGVPVIGRLDGNIDLSQINLDDIERIEIIEGPLSTNYGSNALAGVINIITKKTATQGGKIFANLYTESVGQFNVNLGLSKKIGKSNFRLNVGRNFFSGWSPGDSARWDLWKPKEQYFGRLQANRTLGDVELGWKSEAFKELLLNKGKPLSPYFETAFDEHFQTVRIDQKFSVNWKISEEANLNAFVAANLYNRKRLKYFRDLVTLEEQGINHDGGSDTTGLVAFMSRGTYSRIPKDHRLSYQMGYDLIIEQGSGIRIKDGSQTLSDVALFTTAEYLVTPKLSLKPGIRLSYNSAFETPLVPMISGRWKNRNYTYRASYSQGFRAPDIKELFIEFIDVNHYVVGNSNLQAEHSNHFLLSIDGKRLVGNVIFKPSLTTFYNSIKDKITLASYEPNQYTYVNISEFKSTGGNVRMSAITSGIKLNLGYSITGIKTNLRESNPSYDFYNEWNASVLKTWRKLDFNLFAKYNGQQNFYTIDAQNAAVTQRFTGSYTLVDFQIGRAFLNGTFRLQGGVKNILNIKNINNVLSSSGAHGSDAGYLAVANGRNYFIKISLQPK